jgi:SsrA-binding protein
VAKDKKSKENKSESIQNRKARYDYFIEDTIVCGLVLSGTEIKSIRTGRAQLKDSYARIEKGEAWLYNCNISPYQFGNRYNHEPLRKRKLLLNKREILKLDQKIKEKNYNLIPLKIFFLRNWAKMEIGLGKSKKTYDKRETIKKKELQRSLKETKNTVNKR